MASEHTGDISVSTTVPESLGQWVDETARETDRSRAELLRQLLAAYRVSTESGDGEPLAGELDRLAARIDDLESDYQEQLDDVRNRVVDVKLEADGKASADHEHPELRARMDRLASGTESLQAAVADLRSEVEAGFENYEDVLAYLTDATDDVEEKTDTLARAVLDVREQARTLARRNATWAAADELAHAANRHGIRRADCEECGGTVDIALLSAPECPFCASTFSDVEPAGGLRGLLGSSTLVVGDPPALDGPAVDDELAAELNEGLADAEGGE